VALLDGLKDVAGIQTEAVAVRNDAVAHRARLDELVAASNDHMTMVRQLEAAYDAEAAERPTTGETLGPLPSGDELAAELERFLRDQGH
jgi:hypothetical protein